MFENIVPLNSVAHLDLKINPLNGYLFAKNTHLCSVVLHEFPECSAHYPVVFVKKPGSEKFHSVVLLGLELGENLFVNDAGEWAPGAYVPGAFRRYPFALAQTSANENLVVCMDQDSQYFSRENGQPLFTKDGKESDFLIKVRTFLGEMYNSELMVDKFTAKLQELDLLVPGNLQVNTPNGSNRFDGVFLIDENRLSQLSDEKFLSLREHGFLAAIYSQMASLLQIKKFFAKKNDLSRPIPVTN